MSYSVGQVAELAGVTVRTLHHYGQIGLLEPQDRTSAGYRRYSEDDLDRLRHILFYRELGFSLDDIATILADPGAGSGAHLRRQRELLTDRIHRLQAMVAAVYK
jgi:DNA-binding transcriptional MerR regulator